MDRLTTNRKIAAADISGKDESIVIKTWFFIGCAFLLFMAYVAFQWVTAPGFGPTQLPPGV